MFEDLLNQFRAVLKVDFVPLRSVGSAAHDLLRQLGDGALVSLEEREDRLVKLINSKFALNEEQIAKLYAFAAQRGITFNYHEKVRIRDSFDAASISMFEAALDVGAAAFALLEPLFQPVPAEHTIAHLHAELATPTLTRKDSKPGDRSEEILNALFGGFIFSSFDIEQVHCLLDPEVGERYEPDFWQHLHRTRPRLFSRDKTGVFLQPPPGTATEVIADVIAAEYGDLANHGYVAIHFRGWDATMWQAIGYLTLFAEKFRAAEERRGYFRPDRIERETRAHIPLDPAVDYAFDVVHSGFQYEDTFVFAGESQVDALVLFQRNVADETLIPCPACRSHRVRGNSYPTLGVKSWECENPICPDRSKFNRGKRYSFLQLLKQHSIEDPESEIPRAFVRSWARDVQPLNRSDEALELFLRHYSLSGDGVKIVGREGQTSDNFGRRVLGMGIEVFAGTGSSALSECLGSSYFARFMNVRGAVPVDTTPPQPSFVIGGVTAFGGDSTKLLRRLPGKFAQGAVTSPPYYNAREYSQWPNIYCYLFDMIENARSVYRALADGGLYLFNIFDYFDNEYNVSLSAMGEKRMILSAYCIYMFESVGFSCVGNIVWDKGDIEGKRAFNGGNFSPYYQKPFNCWEHILIFEKPGPKLLSEPLPLYLPLKPVFKIVRGENRHGHTAPFPEKIPALLVDRLPPGSTVLDPYGGSMTTGQATIGRDRQAVCFELNRDYLELARRLLADYERQGSLI